MIQALRVHFLGKSQKESIINHAWKVRDNAFYKSQGAYTFSKFSTNLEEVFTILRDYGESVKEEEKLQLLREKIKTDNHSFNAAVISIILRPDVKTYSAAVAGIY